MNQSSRHHYLPQFYIKNFVNESGVLHVYNKEQGVFNTRQMGPKSIFFEWDRNTVPIGGIPNDSFEQLYAKLDDKISLTISRVLRTKAISIEDMMDIHVFSSLLKWRIPVNDKDFDEIKDQFPYEKLRYEIKIETGNEETNKEALQYLASSDLFNSQKRFIFPFLRFYDQEILLRTYYYSFLNFHPSQNALISDCPVIEEKKVGPEEISNFVFPLSSTDTLIYKNEVANLIHDPTFYFYKDLSVFHLATKYVACRDRAHLDMVAKTHETMKRNNTTHRIIPLLFETI